METYLIIAFRIVIIMALLLVATLFVMGKRPIGELPVFDFLVLVVMGSIVGADIAEPDIPHLPTAFAVVLLAAIQRLVSFFVVKSRRFRKIVTFEPTVVVCSGRLVFANIRRIHYSADEVMMMLREKNVFDISRVEYGIIEANGKMSVLKKPEQESVTAGDMKLPYPPSNNAVTVVLEGRVQRRNLNAVAMREPELLAQIKQRGTALREVFHASVDGSGGLHISTYDEAAADVFSQDGGKKKRR